MRFTIQVRQLPYVRLLPLVLPRLREAGLPDHAIGKLTRAVLDLPEELLSTVVEAIHSKTLDEVLAMLLQQYQEELLQRGEAMLHQKGIALELDEITLTEDLTLQVQVSDIQYAALAEVLLPMLKNKQLQGTGEGIWAKLMQAPAFLVRNLVAAMPGQTLDNAVALLLNRNADRICRKLESLAAGRGVPLEVEAFTAQP